LTADEILEMTKKDEAKMEKELKKDGVLLPPYIMEDISTTDDLQGGLLPFTGPLEDLFTCSASPEIEELLFSEESPSSPSYSLFNVSSPTPTITTGSVTDQDESESSAVPQWEWKTVEQLFPNLMELVATAQANEAQAKSTPFFDPEEFQRWSDLALVA